MHACLLLRNPGRNVVRVLPGQLWCSRSAGSPWVPPLLREGVVALLLQLLLVVGDVGDRSCHPRGGGAMSFFVRFFGIDRA